MGAGQGSGRRGAAAFRSCPSLTVSAWRLCGRPGCGAVYGAGRRIYRFYLAGCRIYLAGSRIYLTGSPGAPGKIDSAPGQIDPAPAK